MNKMIPMLVLLTLGSASFAEGHKQNNNAAYPAAALRAIRANAAEASENAAIYQWMRVNREVDRVVSDAHKVEKALSAESAQLASLQQAVRALRSARLAHDVARIQEAAQQVTASCDALMK